MKHSVEAANNYIKEMTGKINKSFYPEYHFSPPIGWMNDPNGVCFYKGKLNFFYQYNPYDSSWSDMYWGHAVTEDNCIFTHYPVALAPNSDDETTCFSGGAVVNQDEIILIYTKHYEKDGLLRETQSVARSLDGIHFLKDETVVLGAENLPEEVNQKEFRDPNPVLWENGEYAVFIGSKTIENEGCILIYKTKDFKSFQYLNKIKLPCMGVMCECPDFFTLGEKDVLLCSIINLPSEEYRFKNINSVLYIVGKLNRQTGEFVVDYFDELDSGMDFYAPQTACDEDGKRIMLAWMEMWGKDEYYTHTYQHGYCGVLTYPRILTLKDHFLYQTPAKGIEKYRMNSTADLKNLYICYDMSLRLKEDSKIIVKGKLSEEFFSFGIQNGRFYADFSTLKFQPMDLRKCKYIYEKAVEVRVLSDRSSIEIFIAGGKETFTQRYFIDGDRLSIEIENAEVTEVYELSLPEKNFEIKGQI